MQTVLVVGKFYPPTFGGIEAITKQCVDALSSRYKVIVICYNTKRVTEVETEGNVTVIRCATACSLLRQPISIPMAAKVATSKADIVHFHAPNFWAALFVAVFKTKAPLIVTHHADVEGRKAVRALVMPIYSLLINRATHVIVSSMKNIKFSKDLRCDHKKVVEIPFGLNSDVYATSEKPKHDVESVGGKRQVTHLGFCGRLVWYKGLEVLLQAFQGIHDARLSIVGDGPLRGSLEILAGRLNLSDRVEFHGCVSDEKKLQLLREFDVLLLPSTHITETFGISQMEAQMCGIPCITSNLPTGVSDIVENERTGLLVEPGNVAELRSAMRRMIDDTEFRALCSREARKRAVKLFSEEAFGDSYRSLIETSLSYRTVQSAPPRKRSSTVGVRLRPRG